MSNIEVLQKIRNIRELPALPAVASKVLEIASDQDSTAKELSKVISQDQSLTTRTLKLVNSAYYGFPRTVSKITEAVVILGFNTVKNLALSVSVCNFFGGGQGDFDRKRLWEHSVGAAVAATILAKKAMMKSFIEDLFVSGLLHDIGLIIEDQYFHEQFLQALAMSENKNIPIEIAERDILGIDHAMIGKKIGETWKLPSKINNIIGFHHQPQYANGETKKETSVIYIADLVCKLQGFGFDGDQVVPTLRKEPFTVLGISKEELKEITKEFEVDIEKAQDFLELIR
ncbi:MAG TPA: HDOD domain-containing protein [Desulfohalobiaceae bacterium]|nr:HDOD domain-containing protein [Desulfohalobiaceae bacterium]